MQHLMPLSSPHQISRKAFRNLLTSGKNELTGISRSSAIVKLRFYTGIVYTRYWLARTQLCKKDLGESLNTWNTWVLLWQRWHNYILRCIRELGELNILLYLRFVRLFQNKTIQTTQYKKDINILKQGWWRPTVWREDWNMWHKDRETKRAIWTWISLLPSTTSMRTQ